MPGLIATHAAGSKCGGAVQFFIRQPVDGLVRSGGQCPLQAWFISNPGRAILRPVMKCKEPSIEYAPAGRSLPVAKEPQ